MCSHYYYDVCASSPEVPPVSHCLVVSYNRPKLCKDAAWGSHAVTLFNQSIFFSSVYGIFVNTNNTIYISDIGNNTIQTWMEGSSSPTRFISGDTSSPYSIFVSVEGDVYASNYPNSQVDRWLPNATSSLSAMSIYGHCYGLFIDINNVLYCSFGHFHFIVSTSLSIATGTLALVAGQSCSGSTSYLLSGPSGIFLDAATNLYVADWGNNRIQRFSPGQMNAITVAGSGAPGTITLNHPTGIVLDADGFTFIVDTDSNRIIGSDPLGFRCVVGCSNTTGSYSYQLNSPRTMAFDSLGNIWVADHGNNRIQKFPVLHGSCGKHALSSVFDFTNA